MKTEINELLNLLRESNQELHRLNRLRRMLRLELGRQWKALHVAAGYLQATAEEQGRWNLLIAGFPIRETVELLVLLIEHRRSIGDFIAARDRTGSIKAAIAEMICSGPATFNPSRN